MDIEIVFMYNIRTRKIPPKNLIIQKLVIALHWELAVPSRCWS